MRAEAPIGPKSSLSPALSARYAPLGTLRASLQGSIIKVRERSTGRLCAVKVSDKSLIATGRTAAGIRIAENVIAEGRFLTLLSHASPNIVELIEQFEDDDSHYLVLEYMAGGELFDLIVANGACSEQVIVSLFADILSGVAAMHARLLCHLDLSLENILLNADQSVAKLCDMGLARHFQTGQLFAGSKMDRPGKFAYMSPEIYAGQPFDGPRADMWSLGIVLFVMLFGFPPFELASMADPRYVWAASHGLGGLVAQWESVGSVPPALFALVCGLLQPNPAKRWTVHQALRAIRKLNNKKRATGP